MLLVAAAARVGLFDKIGAWVSGEGWGLPLRKCVYQHPPSLLAREIDAGIC